MARFQLPFRVPQLGPRTRRVVRYLGLTLFAIVTFVFALQMTFPYDRVKDKVIEALHDKYEVTIGSVERSFKPGRVFFNAVTLRTRQTKPEEAVTTFFIKKLELDVGILSLLGGTISADIEAQIGAGTLSGSVAIGSFGRGTIEASFTGRALPGDALPMRAVLGLPMTGKIEFDIAMTMPVEKSKLGKTSINWQKVTASFSLACPNSCTFGDGKTKLKPLLKNTRNQVMVGEGIDFGKVNLDSLIAKASIKKGQLKLDKFDAKSKDGELKVDYAMTMEKEFSESVVGGCLRFKGSDDLMKREPKTYAAITTTGAELRGDGLFHIKLSGPFKEMKRLNAECGPNASPSSSGTGGENFAGGRDRPNLTVQPEEVAKPGSAAPPPTPTPTPMDAPPPTHDGGVVNPTGAATPPGDRSPSGAPNPPGDGSVGSAGSAGSNAPHMNSDGPARERPGEQGSAVGSGSAMPPAE